MRRFALVLIPLLLSSLSFSGPNDNAAKKESPYDATIADIKASLGLVPTFMKVYPKVALPSAWAQFKGIQLNPQTALPGKCKELIGLAVSAQIPCDYCVYAHTEFAKLNGATQEEIEEAVAVGALERQWSTVLNGRPIPLEAFKQEVDEMFTYMAKEDKGEMTADPELPKALQEMKQSFGLVPSFMTQYPASGIQGGWDSLKFLMSDKSALPLKTKDLIGLAVSSQVPCSYCVYFDTKSAKADGASKEELDEAVAMAALTRHWSTVLNGNALSSKEFKKEIDQIVANVKKSMKVKKKS